MSVHEALSAEEVLALPAMPSVQQAFAALNISRDLGYQLIRDEEFPLEVQRFGRAIRVRQTDLLALLHLDAETGGGAGVAAPTPPVENTSHHQG